MYLYLQNRNIHQPCRISRKQEYERKSGLGTEVHTIIPAFWEAEVDSSPRGQQIETILANMVKPVSTKNIKIIWAWRCMPVVPAIREAEGKLLEPGRQRFTVSQDQVTALQPGDRVRLHLKNKQNKTKQQQQKNQNWDFHFDSCWRLNIHEQKINHGNFQVSNFVKIIHLLIFPVTFFLFVDE